VALAKHTQGNHSKADSVLEKKQKQNNNIQFSSTHRVSKIPDASSLSFDGNRLQGYTT